MNGIINQKMNEEMSVISDEILGLCAFQASTEAKDPNKIGDFPRWPLSHHRSRRYSSAYYYNL